MTSREFKYINAKRCRARVTHQKMGKLGIITIKLSAYNQRRIDAAMKKMDVMVQSAKPSIAFCMPTAGTPRSVIDEMACYALPEPVKTFTFGNTKTQ